MQEIEIVADFFLRDLNKILLKLKQKQHKTQKAFMGKKQDLRTPPPKKTQLYPHMRINESEKIVGFCFIQMTANIVIEMFKTLNFVPHSQIDQIFKEWIQIRYWLNFFCSF